VAFKRLTRCATDTSYLVPLHLWLLSYFIIGERRAAISYFQNAARHGGPAGGDTSYDGLPHSIYRRILIKTILTCWLLPYTQGSKAVFNHDGEISVECVHDKVNGAVECAAVWDTRVTLTVCCWCSSHMVLTPTRVPFPRLPPLLNLLRSIICILP
jgi:hypothetical protein